MNKGSTRCCDGGILIEPIWTTRDGLKFYDAKDIGDMHLINIARWIVMVNKEALPMWCFKELKRRNLWEDVQALIKQGANPPSPKLFSTTETIRLRKEEDYDYDSMKEEIDWLHDWWDDGR